MTRRLVDRFVAVPSLELRGRTGFTSMTASELAGFVPLPSMEVPDVAAQQPEMLSDENCFSLTGSRCGDKRVPAICLSARRPRLGWCWEGAPDTWLGTASCGGRVAAG